MRFLLRILFFGAILFGGWYGGAKYGAPDFVITQLDAGVSKAGETIASLLGRPNESEDDADGEQLSVASATEMSESSPEQQSNDAQKQAIPNNAECGGASYYADSFDGAQTASGELYQPSKFTAAHKTHPFGTKLRVTRVDDERSVEVTVNDRGPLRLGALWICLTLRRRKLV